MFSFVFIISVSFCFVNFLLWYGGIYTSHYILTLDDIISILNLVSSTINSFIRSFIYIHDLKMNIVVIAY